MGRTRRVVIGSYRPVEDTNVMMDDLAHYPCLSSEKLVELHQQLDQVRDAKTFLAFARALAQDIPNSEWENTTIEAFLDGAVAWAEASNFGVNQGLEASNPWGQFANFLYCGKIYE